MTGEVRIATGEGIARITIDNPPLNLLGAAVRRGLARALDAALSDSAVKVVVLTAAGRTWPAGADMREFGRAVADHGQSGTGSVRSGAGTGVWVVKLSKPSPLVS